jgi:hypothetical protein
MKGQFFFGDASFIAKKNRSEAKPGMARPGAQKNKTPLS